MSSEIQEDEAQGGGLGPMLSQLPSILWHRRWYLVVPAVVGLLAAAATSLLLPTTYQSSGVLLVQSPSLPQDLIGGSASDAIERRIEGIRQQIINRPRLVAMIESNQLYPGQRQDKPLSALVEDMREAITLVPEQMDIGMRAGEQRALSVRLAFEYEDPIKAQAVAQQLLERVIELNASTNTVQRTQAVQFLVEQQADLQRQIAEVEAEIADINVRYGGVLASSSTAMIGGSSMSYDMQIAALERENASLRTQRDNLASADTRDPMVIAAEAQLAGALAVYTEDHPDVAIARRRLAEAQRLARQNIENLPVESIARQIAFNENQIATLRAARANDAAQLATVMAERSRAPLVQQQAAQLQQKAQGLYRQFDDTSNRLLAARAGVRADEEQMGERLVVVDPPVVPDSPSSPNRPLIIALGLAAGAGLGFVLAFAIELLMRPIRDPAAIAAVTGSRPLAMVPIITPRKNEGRRWWWPFGRKKHRFAYGAGTLSNG